MKNISAKDIADCFSYEEFIPRLREAFCGDYQVPQRHHYEYENGVGPNTSTLLVMPAWSNGDSIGIKTVTVSPYNGEFNLPSIQGLYTLINAKDGSVKALLEAKRLTVKRTAAASALASVFLSREDASTLCMVGTGALAPELIKAHCSVRPIKKVYIWGRSVGKAQAVMNALDLDGVEIEAIGSIEKGVGLADIISVATLSPTALVLGKWLHEGQHLDLVGAYKPNMREADNECVRRSSVFVDTYEGATKEGGDIVIPLEQGILTKSDIRADLFGLCRGVHEGRISSDEITFFKSVGHALEDLSAALYIMDKLTNE